MITVKELVPLLKEAKKIVLEYDGEVRDFDPLNALDVDAYGDFVIDKIINRFHIEEYEIRIASHPIKKKEER